jgi:hypothetical protein
VALVWACPITVKDYAAAGRTVPAPVLRCPRCATVLARDGTYRRWLCHHGARLEILIPRGRCRRCRVSHALLPDFVVAHHTHCVDTIAAAVSGRGGESVAPSTAAGWRRRFAAHHAALAAGVAAAQVAWGGDAPPRTPTPPLVELVVALWQAARRRAGRVPAPWRLWNLVTGTSWLATRVNSTWAGVGVVPVPGPSP